MSKANARFPLSALSAALLCAALAACGGGGGGDDAPQSGPTGGTGGSTTQTTNAAATDFSTGLNRPTGIARDAAGNFYVADAGTFTIRRIPAAGGASTAFAGAGTSGNVDGPLATATFSDLRGITVTPDGVVYVIDGRTVRLVPPSGSTVTIIGETALDDPRGIVVDAAFNVFVADVARGTITRGNDRGLTVVASGLNNPRSLALDSAGDLYVTEGAAGGATTIRRIAGAATAAAAVTPAAVNGGTGLTGITGIAVAGTAPNLTISAIAPTAVTTLTTSNGSKTTKTVTGARTMSGVATAATGSNILVTDSTGNKVLRVTP